MTEEVDEAGNVVERKEEAIDWGSKMRVVDHIGVDPSAPTALPTAEAKPAYVTRDELRDLLAPRRVRMQEVVESKLDQSKVIPLVNLGLAVLIAAQVAVIGYILFFM